MSVLYFHSEILRVVDSLQLTDRAKVATPVDWKVSITVYCMWFVGSQKRSQSFRRKAGHMPHRTGDCWGRKVLGRPPTLWNDDLLKFSLVVPGWGQS